MPIFNQTAVFVPNERENLGAYMAVVADAANPDYGRIRVLRLSDTHQVPGPNQTFNAIQTDQRVQQALLPFVAPTSWCGSATTSASARPCKVTGHGLRRRCRGHHW